MLAHGGSLFIPPIEGIDKQGVHSCKQLAAADRLDQYQGSAAVVIGSGAIGIEAGEALKKRGYEVTIIELLDWVLPALFDPETSRRLAARMNDCGMRVLTAEKVLRIEGGKSVAAVVTDKRRIPCDTVVIATGVVPGKALAQTAGIEVGRGIRVDEHLQTSVAGIYACGDCVETVDACTGEDAMFQLKHNALEQARVVARNLLGEPAVYPGAWAFARAHFFDTHAVTFGKTTRATQCELGQLELIERDEGEDYLRVVVKEGLVVGGQAIGRFADFIGLFIGAMWRKDQHPRHPRKLAPHRPRRLRLPLDLPPAGRVDRFEGLTVKRKAALHLRFSASRRRKPHRPEPLKGYRAGMLLSIASQNPMTLGSHNTRSGI